MESESTESDPEKNATPKKKKQTRNELKYEKHNKQKYSSSWDLNPKFQKWIKPVNNNPYKAFCCYCNVTLATEIISINKHCETLKHIRNSKVIKNVPTINECFKNSKLSPLSDKVKIAEIKISGFIAEHNISFLPME